MSTIDEQEQNQDRELKQVEELAKRGAKSSFNAAKKAIKKGVKLLVDAIGWKYTLIITAVIIGVILLLCLFVFIITYIDGAWDADSESNAPYMVAQELGQVEEKLLSNESEQNNNDNSQEEEKVNLKASTLDIIKLDDNKGYSFDFDLDQRVENIIEKLKENKGRLDVYLSKDKQTEYLKTFIKAELVTQYPDLRSVEEMERDNVQDRILESTSDNFHGAIKVRRYKNGEEGSLLDYVDLDTFNSYIDNNNNEALNHFSLTEDMQLIVAQYNSTTTTTASDLPGTKGTDIKEGGYTTSTLDYKSMLAQHSMPFDFLWGLLVITQDEDFVYDLAKLALNSDIEIGIYDNITYTKVVKNTKYKETIDSDIQMKDLISGTTKSYTYTDENNYQVVEETVSTSNMPTLAINKAHTWIVNYDREYTYEATSMSSEEKSEPDKPLQSDIDEKLYENSSEINNTLRKRLDQAKESFKQLLRKNNEKIYNENASGGKSGTSQIISQVQEYKLADAIIATKTKLYQLETKTTTNIISRSYLEGEVTIEEKTDKNKEGNFVYLFTRYEKAYSRLMSAPEWFFKILQASQKASNMEDTIRYLLYKASGKDLGVTSLNLTLFDLSNFSSVSNSYELLKEYIHKWENSSGAPTNADGTMYKIISDGAGHPTVGYGVDINNSGYKAKFIAAGYPTEIGGYVPVEFVDAIEDEILESNIKAVKSKTSGLNLTEYQINALVSRSYQAGLAGALTKSRNGFSDFVAAYKSCWKSSDDLYEKGATTGDFTHPLFTKYMQYPTSSSLAGIPRRRKSEWTLFQTGYYDVLGKRHTTGGSIAAGGVGTLGVYTSSVGKKYNLYIQGGSSPWKNESYSKSNMASAGCGPTAEAIIASAYNGNITPSTTRADIVKRLGLGSNWSNATNIGASLKRLVPGINYSVGSFDETRIKNTLRSGGQVWLVVRSSRYTNNAHCIALIDYKEPGQVYVAHGSANSRPYGWDSLSYIRSVLSHGKPDVLYVGG